MVIHNSPKGLWLVVASHIYNMYQYVNKNTSIVLYGPKISKISGFIPLLWTMVFGRCSITGDGINRFQTWFKVKNLMTRWFNYHLVNVEVLLWKSPFVIAKSTKINYFYGSCSINYDYISHYPNRTINAVFTKPTHSSHWTLHPHVFFHIPYLGIDVYWWSRSTSQFLVGGFNASQKN